MYYEDDCVVGAFTVFLCSSTLEKYPGDGIVEKVWSCSGCGGRGDCATLYRMSIGDSAKEYQQRTFACELSILAVHFR
jgi:hypothetical protein